MTTTDETTLPPGALPKPRRSELLQIQVIAFKPPRFTERKEPELVYVDERGNEKSVVCSDQLWRQVDGNPMPRRKPRGLDGIADRNRFVLYVEGKGSAARAVGLTKLPSENFMFGKQSGHDERLEGVEDITVTVDATTGNVDVLIVPPGARLAQVLEVIRLIDSVTYLAAGQSLGRDVSVVAVSGNRVQITMPVVEERTYRTMGPE